MNAASFVYGLETLFHVYAESQFWRHVDLINALANWWGVTPRAINKRMESDGFSAQVERIDAEIAALFWPSKVAKETPAAATSESPQPVAQAPVKRNVRLPVQDVRFTRRSEGVGRLPPPAVLSTVHLKRAPIEPLPAVVLPGELGWIAEAVHACVGHDTLLWARRMRGEGELSYVERVGLIARHVGLEFEDLRSLLNNPELMDALVRHDSVAADFIGYDFAAVDLITSQISSDAFTNAATKVIEDTTGMGFGRALMAVLKNELSIDYGKLMAGIGEIVEHSDEQPFASLRASMHYRYFYDDYALSNIGKVIGPPPTP
jgi:hypothetical protein